VGPPAQISRDERGAAIHNRRGAEGPLVLIEHDLPLIQENPAAALDPADFQRDRVPEEGMCRNRQSLPTQATRNQAAQHHKHNRESLPHARNARTGDRNCHRSKKPFRRRAV
jgi:hypothetical protein